MDDGGDCRRYYLVHLCSDEFAHPARQNLRCLSGNSIVNNLLEMFREYPVLIGVTMFLTISLLLALLLGAMMRRAGVSLKPLVFFFGFVAIIAVPQAVVHLLDAFVHARQVREAPSSQVTTSDASAVPASTALKPVSWDIVFGPNADPSLITDAKQGLNYILADAVEAKISFNAAGESALAARFKNPEEAAAALNRYGSFFRFAQVTGSDAVGWTARRFNGQGEWNHVVVAGNELYAWSGQTKESVEADRIRALGPLPPVTSSIGTTASPSGLPSKTEVSARLSSSRRAITAFLVINLLLAVFWFFKGSAWSARQRPQPGVRPEAAELLRQRLLSVNQQNVPVQVVESPNGDNTLQITWRYGDAQWLDLMRVHKMHRTHKLVLSLDQQSHTARVREYWSAFDASASPSDLRFNWTAARGMQFFEFEHRRVFGVQLDPGGKPSGELSKAYTFNLQELKHPIIEAVTANGWTWQPVMWNAPDGLRWLTE